MTLHATRDTANPEYLKVHCTYGPVTFIVDEHQASAASFWAQLGRVLAENPAHRTAHAKAAYERHMGPDDQLAWEELDETERDRWRNALFG
jgi:hypothetical protein